MKRILFFAFCLLSTIGFSQNVQVVNANLINDLSPAGLFGSNSNASSQKVSALCGVDTVQYTLQKATGLALLNINSATSATAISQYFNAPQAITVSGFEFFAFKADVTNGITQSIDVQMYLAGADSLPTGLPLAATSLTIDTNFYGGTLSLLQKSVTFPAVTVTQPYVMVFSNPTGNPVSLIFNSYTAGDGQMEWLAGVQIGANWLNSYDVNIGGGPFDADMLGYPHVEYNLTSDFTAADGCLLTGTTTFTNNSSPVVSDRMYNLATYLGLEDLSYTWDYDDGSPEENAIDPLHVFPSIGYNADVKLTDTLFGWSVNCVADTVIPVGDSLENIWSSSVNSLQVDFTDLTFSHSNVLSYLWDFGDGNTSSLQDPSHNYAVAGTYTVCCTVVNDCGASDSSCQSVMPTLCSLPDVDFSSITSGAQVDFSDLSTVTGTSTVWAWDFGDGNVSTQQNPSHVYAATGNYTVVLVVTDDCGVDSISYNIDVFICIDPIPSFTVVNNEPSYDFTNTSASNGTTTYSWDMGDLTTYSTQDASHTYTANATYTVTLTVTDSCGVETTTQDITVSIIGINELEPLSISIYPIPASNQITVEASQVISDLEVLDLAGRSVFKQTSNSSATVLSTLTMANGEYLLKINLSNGQNEVRRISVLH
ncbi:MAG: PKD repeat protein [Crocinitomicaceae bacterium]|jgi:PKD repeat protein